MTLAASLFVSGVIHKRDITLPDGTTHVLHFKELPAVGFRSFQLAETSDDDEVRAASMVKLIASSLCEEDGKPAITQTEAARLTSAAANALISAILEINGFGTKKNL